MTPQQTTAARPPLAGVKVVDLSTLTPGPFATRMLAELGATVVKVERAGSGDPLRQMLPKTFDMLNHGKASIELDLTDPADREVLLQLCEDADVFVEGFRPGVVERLGVGFDVVRSRAPGITYLSLNSYGGSGPLAHVPGHDLNFVARAGGLAAGDPSGYGVYQVADLAAAAYTVIAVLAGLRSRDTTRVDLSLLGSALAFTQLAAAEAEDLGAVPDDEHEARPANAVFTAGDGRQLTVCAVEDRFWQDLCPVLGLDELATRPEFTGYADRLQHAEEINTAVARALSHRTRDEWLDALQHVGVPAAPVLTHAEAREDDQVRHLGLAGPRAPAVPLPALGIGLAELGPPPGLGAHTALLREQGWDGLARPGDGVPSRKEVVGR